jgi:WD40 repeat protein
VLTGHTRGIAALQFDKKETAVSGSSDKTIRVWNINTGECVRVLAVHHDLVRSLHLDSVRIVSGSYDGTCVIWDSQTFEQIMVIRPTPAPLVLTGPNASVDLAVSAPATGMDTGVVWSPVWEGGATLSGAAGNESATDTGTSVHVPETTAAPALAPTALQAQVPEQAMGQVAAGGDLMRLRVFKVVADASRVFIGDEQEKLWVFEFNPQGRFNVKNTPFFV